jgi:hypothetical protein
MNRWVKIGIVSTVVMPPVVTGAVRYIVHYCTEAL